MKLYVLVRRDLSPKYRAVQAGHAVAEWLLRDHITWQNNTLVYLGVRDEKDLYRWIFKLKKNNIGHVYFKEPALGNQITAIAAASSGEMFKDLKLL